MNLVVGKFYPPHEGHHYIIEEALKLGPTLVVVMYSKDETISVDERMAWIKDRHYDAVGKLIVRACADDLPEDFNDPAVSDQHAQLLDPMLVREGWHIDRVIGSEPYVQHLADYYDAIAVMIDHRRHRYPISSTMIREDTREYWEQLAPATRAGLCKRIVCIGAESCGTTTLARDLSAKLGTVWVPEYGRYYSDGLGVMHIWTPSDFDHIRLMQQKAEDQLARQSSGGLLICDTNTMVTDVWQKFLINRAYVGSAEDTADLYLITDFCPWEDDGTRLLARARGAMQAVFIERAKASGKPYHVVTGTREERVESALAFALPHLPWHFG